MWRLRTGGRVVETVAEAEAAERDEEEEEEAEEEEAGLF